MSFLTPACAITNALWISVSCQWLYSKEIKMGQEVLSWTFPSLNSHAKYQLGTLQLRLCSFLSTRYGKDLPWADE